MKRAPRTSFFLGGPGSPIFGENGTWLESESLCYPSGGRHRWCRAVNAATGRLNTVRCGIPDTFYSVPCDGGWVGLENGAFVYHPRRDRE